MTTFHDDTNTSMLITSLSSIKRFIMLGDIHMGVTFLQLEKKTSNNTNSFEKLSKVTPLPLHHIPPHPSSAQRSICNA